MVRAGFEGQAKVGADEGGAQFGDKFLAGIGLVSKATEAQVAVETSAMAGPVGLMPISA